MTQVEKEHQAASRRTPYYETLSADKREALFAVMRELDKEAQDHSDAARKLVPPVGWVPADGGGPAFDEVLKAEVRFSYLRALNAGATLDEARAKAEAGRFECVRSHNARQPDIYVRRSAECAEEPLVHRVYERLKQALGEPEIDAQPQSSAEP